MKLETKVVKSFAAGCIFTILLIYLVTWSSEGRIWIKPLNRASMPIEEFYVEINGKFFGVDSRYVHEDKDPPINTKISKDTSYSVVVVFSDGSKLVSEPRYAQPGWGIYEYIYNDHAEQDIRVR